MTKLMNSISNRRYARTQAKMANKQKKNKFDVEPLEQRLLLSADPITSTLQAIMLNDNKSNEYIISTSNSTIAQNSIDLNNDIIKVTKNNEFVVDAKALSGVLGIDRVSIQLQDGIVLGGSGDLNADLINNSIVSPGYSPGKQDFASYTQSSNATLEIEIAGTSDGEYDQVNVTNVATFDGTLQISLLDGFLPKVGDRFNIINFDSANGKFANLDGMYGFKGDYYFEIEQSSNKIDLVVKEIISGDNNSFITNSSDNDNIGTLLNSNYLNQQINKTLTATLNLDNTFYATGSYNVSYIGDKTLSLSDNTTDTTKLIQISMANGSGFFGLNYGGSEVGIDINDVDIALAIFNSTNTSNSWLVSKANLSDDDFVGLSNIDLSSSSLKFVSSMGYGASNNTVAKLSSDAITISGITLNDSGANGEKLDIEGSATLSVEEFVIDGDFVFKKNNNKITATASDVTAKISQTNIEVGVQNGTLGLIADGSGYAIEASGNILLSGVFDTASASSVSLKYNNSGIDYSNTVVDTFTFSNFNTANSVKEINTTNFNANLLGMSVSGNFDFKASTNSMNVIGTNVTALLKAGDFTVGTNSAKLGMIVDATGKKSLQIKNGNVQTSLSDDISLTASSMYIEYNDTVSISNNQISTNNSSFTFSNLASGITTTTATLDTVVMYINDFVELSADSISFHKDTNKHYTLSDGSGVDVDLLSVGAEDGISAFIGLEIDNSLGRTGIVLNGASFALALLSDKTNNANKYTTLKAKAKTIGFTGSMGIGFESDNLELLINNSTLKDSDNKTVTIDYSKTNLSINTSTTNTISFANLTQYTQIATGTVSLNAYDFIYASATMSFEKSEQIVTLSDNSFATVDVLTTSAVNINAFAGFDFGSVDSRVGFILEDFDFAFVTMIDKDDASRKWTTIQGSISKLSFSGLSGLSISANNAYLSTNSASNDELVVDFKKMGGLSISGFENKINIDGAYGSHIALGATFELSAFGLFTIEQSFNLRLNTQKMYLSDGSYVDGIILSTAITDIDFFVGVGEGTDDAVGVQINDIDIGFAISATLQTGIQVGGGGEQRSLGSLFYSIQVDAEDVGFVGFGDFMTIETKKVSLYVNSIDSDGLYINYGAKNLTISSLNGGSNFVMDMSVGGRAILLSDVNIALLSFVYIQGDVALQMGTNLELNVDSTSAWLISDTMSFDYFSFGANDVKVFVGLNGPYFGDGDAGDALGFYVNNLDIAFAMFVEQKDLIQLPGEKKFRNITAKAHITEVATVGFDSFMSLSLKDIDLNMNLGMKKTQIGKEFGWINFAKSLPAVGSNPIGFEVLTGGDSIYLDYTTGFLEASIGLVDMQVAEFLYLRGSFALTVQTSWNVEVNLNGLGEIIDALVDANIIDTNKDFTESTITVDMLALSLAGADLYGFVGIGGPYRSDTNGDGIINDSDPINEKAIGAAINNVDFGMILATPALVVQLGLEKIPPIFVTVKASVESAKIVGIDEDILAFRIEDIEININTMFFNISEPTTMTIVNGILQVFGAPFIDYKATYKDYTEDKNQNGILDTSEDSNQNGVLDASEDKNQNGVLDIREDGNLNDKIDTGGYALNAGGESTVFIDFNQEIVQASIGYFYLNIAGFVQATGSMSFTKKSGEEVTLDSGDKVSVTSIAFGLNDINAFAGVGGYFQDTNNDTRIDEKDTRNTSAVGFVLDDMDLGIIVMLEIGINPVSYGVYYGAYASIHKVGFVGIPKVTLEANDLELALNTGFRVSTSGPVGLVSVDFSKSKWKNSQGVEQEGYGIPTGNLDEPIVLKYTENLLYISGQVNINLFDVIEVDGVIDLELSESGGLSLFAHADISIGKEDLIQFKQQADVLLIINEGGIAGKFAFNIVQDLGGVAELKADFTVCINSFGKDIVYTVDEKFVDAVGYSQVTISSKPKGEENAVDFYISMEANGYINILNTLKADGSIYVVFLVDVQDSTTTVEARLDISATLDMSILEPVSVAGSLGFSNGGLFGSLQIGNPFDGGSTIIQSDIFSISGGFLLQINTTLQSQTVKSLEVDAQGNTTGKYLYTQLDPTTFFIAGSVQLTLLDAVEFYGSGSFLINQSGLKASVKLSLSLGDFGNVALSGAMELTATADEGPIFAMRNELEVNLGLAGINISANALLEINTSTKNEYAGVAAGTLFNLELDGNLKIIAFDIAFKGAMSIKQGVFELRIDEASIDFFGFINIDVSGYFRSDGAWNIKGEASISLDIAIVEISGKISLELGNDIVAVSLSASIYIDFWLFDFELAGFSAEIELTSSYAYFAGSIGVFGKRVSFDKMFKYGDDPKIATQSGSVLYLNMGDRWQEREPDLSNPRYKDFTNETYNIYGNEDGSISVVSLGITKTYSNITEIRANGGSGNDTITIAGGLKNQKIYIDGGDGNDKILVASGGTNISITGGAGDDEIETSVKDAIIYAGGGKNKITTGDGNDTVFVVQGSENTINVGAGNNVVYDTLLSSSYIAGSLTAGNTWVQMDGITSDSAITLGTNSIKYKSYTTSFDESVHDIVILDWTVGTTVINTNYTNNIGFTNTNLFISTEGKIDFSNAKVIATTSLLFVTTNGVVGNIYTDVDEISVINNATDEAYADITIIEDNDIKIIDAARERAGLNTLNGAISVTVLDTNSYLKFETGVISVNEAEKDIVLNADHILLAGSSKNIIGLGNFEIVSSTMSQSYRIGSLGLSDLTGKTLNIKFLNGYTPQVGDKFDIFTFSDTTGNFSTSTGFFGFKSDYYLDVTKLETSLQVEVKELIEGDTFSFLTDALQDYYLNEKQNNSIGMWLNCDYFNGIPIEITVSTTLNIMDSFYVSGTFTLGYQENRLLTLSDKKDVITRLIKVGIEHTDAFFGLNYATAQQQGLLLKDVTIGMGFFTTMDDADTRGWVIVDTKVGSAEVVGISGLELSSTSLSFSTSFGYGNDSDGAQNTTVVNLSTNPLDINNILLKDNGKLGTRISVSGDANLYVAGFDIGGTLAFRLDNSKFIAFGEELIAKYESDVFDVGIQNGKFGLIADKDGVVFEVSGAVLFDLDGIANASADAITIRYNDTGKDYTNYILSIDTFSYTFGDFKGGTDLSEASITNLSINILDSVVVSGSFGVKGQGGIVTLISNSANAIMQVGTFKVGVQNASLGLQINNDGSKILQSRGGLLAQLGDDIKLGAEVVSIEINETTENIVSKVVSAGDVSYTFKNMEKNLITPKIGVDNAYISLYDFFRASGNFAFYKSSNQSINTDSGEKVDIDLMSIGVENLDAFAGISKNDGLDKLGLTLSGVSVAMAFMADKNNASRNWFALKAKAKNATFEGIDNLDLQATNTSVELNISADDGSVVDFSTKQLVVNTGASTSVTFDIDGEFGQVIRASTNLNINLFDFFSVSGGFAIETSTQSLKLSDGNDVSVDMLSIGTNSASGFIGYDNVGLKVTNANIALAYLKEQDGTREWITSKSNIKDISFVGVSDLTLKAKDFSIDLNTASEDDKVIDYSAKNLTISTSTSTSVKFDFSKDLGEIARVSGELEINVFNFFSIKGGVAIDKSVQDIVLSDSSNISANMLSIGLNNASGFIGVNGGEENSIGLSATGVSVALALFNHKETNRSWTTLKADIDSVAFVGIEDLSFSATNTKVEINTKSSDGKVIDYKTKNLNVKTGSNSTITLQYDGALGEIVNASGQADVDLFGYAKVKGAYAISSQENKSVYLAQEGTQLANSVNTNMLSIALSQVDSFLGNDNNTADTSDDTGISLKDIDLAIALFSENSGARSWSSVIANIKDIDILGLSLPENLSFDISNTYLSMNTASSDGSVIDYVKSDKEINNTQLSIKTENDTIDFNIDGNKGEYIQFGGYMTLNLFDFAKVEGGFGYQSQLSQIIASDDTSDIFFANSVSFSIYDGSAFIGYDSNTASKDDDFGLSLKDMNFALSFFKEQDGSREWISVNSTIKTIEALGISDVVIKANNVSLVANMSAGDDSVIDFATMNTKNISYKVKAVDAKGVENSITYDADGSKGMYIDLVADIDISLYGYFKASGTIGISFSKQDMYVSNSQTATKIDFMVFSAKNLDAFIGVDNTQGEDVGLVLDGVTFAFTLAQDTQTGYKYISVQASANSASIEGITDSMSLSASDISVLMNIGFDDNGLVDSVIDYKKSEELGSKVGSDDTKVLSINGNEGTVIKAELKSTISVSEFFTIEGYISLQISQTDFMLSDDSILSDANLIYFGGKELYGYVGTNANTEDFVGLSLENLGFGIALITKDDLTYLSAKASANKVSFEDIDDITLEMNSIDVSININASDNTAIDYKATKTKYGIQIGSGESGIFDMSSAGISAKGGATIKAYDFFFASGTLVFEKTTYDLVLNNSSSISVDTLTIGAMDINGFVGFGYGTENKIGFELSNLDFMMLSMDEIGGDRKYTALKASVDSIGFSGYDDFEITGKGVVELNIQASDGTMVNFSAKKLTISSKTSVGDGMVFDIPKSSSNLFSIEGDFKLNLLNFIKIEQHIVFNQTFQTLTLSDNNTVAVGYISFSQKDIDMFLGFNGGTAQELGFKISDAEFGIGLFVDITNPQNVWVASQASISDISFVGVKDMTIDANDLTLNINTVAQNNTNIDFAKQKLTLKDGFGAGGILQIGDGEGITLDMAKESFMLSGNMNLSLFGVVGISGSFGFEKTTKSVKLSNNTTATVDAFVVGAENVDAFVGFNVFDDEDKVGFSIKDFDFGLAIMVDKSNSQREWITLQANAGFVGFTGIADLKIGASDVSLSANIEAVDKTIVDYNQTGGLDIPNVSFDINPDVSLGSHISFDGKFEFNAFNLVQLEKDMSFIFNINTVTLNDGSTDSVIVLSTALTDISIFAGVGENTNNPIGLKVDDIDIGFALSYSILNQRLYLGLQGSGNGVSTVGMSQIASISAQSVGININIPDLISNKSIDYSKSPLTIKSLNGNSDFIMNMGSNSSASATLYITGASVELANFVYVSGNFAYSIGSGATLNVDEKSLLKGTVTTTKDFYYLTFGGSDLDVYFGLNSPYYGTGDKANSLGFYANDIDFGFGIFVEDVVSTYIKSLNATQLANLATSVVDGSIDVSSLASSLSVPMLNVASKLHMAQIGLVGFDNFMSVTLKDITLNLNFGISAPDVGSNIPKMPYINFATSKPATQTTQAGFAIPTGGSDVYLDFSSSMIGASIGFADMQLADFLYLRGSFGISFHTALTLNVGLGGIGEFVNSLASNELFDIKDILGESFDLTKLNLNLDSIPLDMYSLAFAGSDLYGFVGVGGSYYNDTNNDGVIDNKDSVNNSAFGVAIKDVDFGMMLSMPSSITELEKIGLGGRVWPVFVSAKAQVGEALFVGSASSSLFSMKTEDVQININTFFMIVAIEEPTTLAIVNLAINSAFLVLGAPYIDYSSTFSSYTEDTNNNGVLDLGEDANLNGSLDAGEDTNNNGKLDLREDINQNGVIDTKGFVLQTGSNSGIILDFDSEVMQIGVGYSELNIAGMLQVNGSMMLSKEGNQEVVLSNGEKVTVNALSMAMNNVNAFMGFGGYFQDTNKNGRYDDKDVRNKNAVGFVLDDLDIALTLMIENSIKVDSVNFGIYTAGYFSLDKIGLSGIDYVTIQSEDSKVEYNAGIRAHLGLDQIQIDENNNIRLSDDILNNLPITLTTVDFSKSTYQDKLGTTHSGYAINTGDIDNPIVISYQSYKLAMSGELDINIYNTLVIQGAIDVDFDSTKGIAIFGDVHASIGTDATVSLGTDATVLLIINDSGVAGKFAFESDVDLALMGFGGSFEVEFNSTGKDVVYELNKSLTDNLGYTSVTISASVDVEKDTDFYLHIKSDGYVKLLDTISLSGNFEILYLTDGSTARGIYKTKAEFSMATTLDLGFISPIGIAGTLGFYNGGLYGAFEIGNPIKGDTIIASGGLVNIYGGYLLQVNTTNYTQTVKSIELDSKNNMTGKFVDVSIEKGSIYWSGKTTVDIAGFTSFIGTSHLSISQKGFEGSSSFSAKMEYLGYIYVSGNIAIINTEDEGFVFALRGESSLAFGVDVVGIKASAIIEINTSKLHSYAGVDANKLFNVELDGSLNLFAFNMTFKGSASYVDNIFELKIDKASMNFFNFVNISLDGYVRSDGTYRLHGQADIKVNLLIVELQGTLDLTLGHDIFSASIDGGLYLYNIFSSSYDIRLAEAKGALELTVSKLHAVFSVEILGMKQEAVLDIKIGEDPIIASQDGDTLYLNIGDRYTYREMDLDNQIYNQANNERYTVWQDGDTVYVEAMRTIQTFKGVKKIVADAGDGFDTIKIDKSVNKQLMLQGGSGNDVISVATLNALNSEVSGGENNDTITNYTDDMTIYAGDGDDIITNYAKNVTIYGGSGNDTIVGSENDDIIDAGDGIDKVVGNGGNDTITILAGEASGDAGDDTIYTSLGNVLKIAGNDGYDRMFIDVYTGINPIYIGDYSMTYQEKKFSFDSTIEDIALTDLATKTTLVNENANKKDWTNTNLTINTAGTLNASDATLDLSNGRLIMNTNSIDGVLNTNVDTIEINNKNSNISINEANSLNVNKIVNNGSVSIKSNSIATSTAPNLNVGSISTQNGNIVLDSSGDVLLNGLVYTQNGNISILAENGAIKNNTTNWLKNSDNGYDKNIIWAIQNNKFSVNTQTGEIIVANVTPAEESQYIKNGTVLREANNSYLHTANGKISLLANHGIGKNTLIDNTQPNVSEILNSIYVNAKELSVYSLQADDIAVLSNASIKVVDYANHEQNSSAMLISSLGGSIKSDVPIDAKGKDIVMVADDIVISNTVASAGGELKIVPSTSTKKIVIGDISGDNTNVVQLDLSEINNLGDGFSAIVIGGDDSNMAVQIGDKSLTNSVVTFKDTLVIKNPAEGGEIAIDSKLVLVGGSSFFVYGSGHTTTFANDLSVDTVGLIFFSDSIKIDGSNVTNNTINISSESGNITLGNQSYHTLNGDSIAGDDKLSIVASAGGDIIINSIVGNIDPLEKLTLVGDDITFNQALNVGGDLSIDATGVINFISDVSIDGDLIINNASSVNFAGNIDVKGDIIITLNGDMVVIKSFVVDTNLTIKANTITTADNIYIQANHLKLDTTSNINANIIADTLSIKNSGGNVTINVMDKDIILDDISITAQNNVVITTQNGDIYQNAKITTSGNISIISSNDIFMDKDSSTTSNKNVYYKANNIDVAYINASEGNVQIEASEDGKITDANNDSSVNIVAESINLIGRGVDGYGEYIIYPDMAKIKNQAIETQSSKIYNYTYDNKGLTSVQKTVTTPVMGYVDYAKGDETWSLQFVSNIEVDVLTKQTLTDIPNQNLYDDVLESEDIIEVLWYKQIGENFYKDNNKIDVIEKTNNLLDSIISNNTIVVDKSQMLVQDIQLIEIQNSNLLDFDSYSVIPSFCCDVVDDYLFCDDEIGFEYWIEELVI